MAQSYQDLVAEHDSRFNEEATSWKTEIDKLTRDASKAVKALADAAVSAASFEKAATEDGRKPDAEDPGTPHEELVATLLGVEATRTAFSEMLGDIVDPSVNARYQVHLAEVEAREAEAASADEADANAADREEATD